MMRRLAIAVLLGVLAAAPAGAATVQERFDGGVQAWQAGKFGEAAATFRELADRFGVAAPGVLVNLAAAEFSNGRPGAAILALHRAVRVAPDHPETERARVALERARAALNEAAGGGSTGGAAFVFGSYHDAWTALFGWLDPSWAMGAFLAAWAATFGLLGAGRLARSPERARRLLAAAAVLAVVAVAAGIGAWGSDRVAGYRVGVVMSDGAGLLDDVASTEAAMALPEGLEVRILAERGGFVQVRLPSGRSGWLASRSVGVP